MVIYDESAMKSIVNAKTNLTIVIFNFLEQMTGLDLKRLDVGYGKMQ